VPLIDDTLMRWFADHDLDEELRWTTHRSPLVTWVDQNGNSEPSGEIKFYLLCNDMFWWGTADCEWIEIEDIPDLQKAYDDLKAADLDDVCMWCYAPELWISRKRGMRPQRPWWNREKIPQPVKDLFCAAGPERDPKDEG
jgi:hypothetical protein